MKPDRFALYCDIDLDSDESVARVMRWCTALFEELLVAMDPPDELSWLIEVNGESREGTERSAADVVRVLRETSLGGTLSASVSSGSARRPLAPWAELNIEPAANADGGLHEVFVQAALPGSLMEKPEARRFEELLLDGLHSLLSTEHACHQAFISDDIEQLELPLEDALKIPWRVASADSARILRNVSWVTYLSASMVNRLRDQNVPTEDLGVWRWSSPSGGLLVRFADSIEDFSGERIVEAWRSLLPALRSDAIPQRAPRYASRTVSAFVDWPAYRR